MLFRSGVDLHLLPFRTPPPSLRSSRSPPFLLSSPSPLSSALLPGTLRALVGRNIPEWPPAAQSSSSEVAPPLERAPEPQEAPQTTSPTGSPIPSPCREDQDLDLDLDQAPGAEQQPGGGEPERVEPSLVQQQPQPSVVTEQHQLTEETGNQSVVAQQPPAVASPGITQPQVVAEELQEVIPSGIEQLLAFAEQQQQQQQELLKQQSAVAHPCAAQPSMVPPITSAEPEHFGIVELLKIAEQHKQSIVTASVQETVDTSGRQTADITTQGPPAVQPALTSDTSTSVSDVPHTATCFDNTSC